QQCIPQGLAPPANCGSLVNVECICTNPTFLLSIADCEQSTCTDPEFAQIAVLSEILCRPFGGLSPGASSAAESFIATYTNTLPSTPSIVATPTAPIAANASDITIYPDNHAPSKRPLLVYAPPRPQISTVYAEPNIGHSEQPVVLDNAAWMSVKVCHHLSISPLALHCSPFSLLKPNVQCNILTSPTLQPSTT
ncbi:MAG: hypothetical protein Q9169_008241, partial [Polycauliona sp. 2 TL-2023]